MERSKVAIVIPAYNEEQTILAVIKKILVYGTPIIINDNSSDKTHELIKYCKFKKIFYYKNLKNIGYEKSIQKGFELAIKNNFNYIITFDADNQHIPEDIKHIKNYFDKGYDVVVGERVAFQRFSEKVFSLIFRIFFNIKDPLTGLKGYRSEVFKKNNKIFDSNFLVGVELLIKALIQGNKVAKFNIKTFKRKGKSRYGQFFKGNLKILRALFFCLIIWIKFRKNGN